MSETAAPQRMITENTTVAGHEVNIYTEAEDDRPEMEMDTKPKA